MTKINEMSLGALRLFRTGSDTVEIATRLGISEASASRLVWVARSREKGLPSTYVTKGREMLRMIEPAKKSA